MEQPDFGLAERQVRECEDHAEEQRSLIAYLERGGYKDAADVVRRMLAKTEGRLARRREQLAKLRADLAQRHDPHIDQGNQTDTRRSEDHP